MKRAPWIAALVLLSTFAGQAQAIPNTSTVNINNNVPDSVFDYGVPIDPLNIIDGSLNVDGLLTREQFFFLQGAWINWTLDGAATGTTFQGGLAGTTVPYSATFVLSPAATTQILDGVGALGVNPVLGLGIFNGTATLTVNTIAPIPEPGTVLLFLCGALGAGAAARKKTRDIAPG